VAGAVRWLAGRAGRPGRLPGGRLVRALPAQHLAPFPDVGDRSAVRDGVDEQGEIAGDLPDDDHGTHAVAVPRGFDAQPPRGSRMLEG
jgi:hypothetical protein